MPASAENNSPAAATNRSATLSPRAQPPNLLLSTQTKMATATSSSTPNAEIIAVCPVMICQPPVSKQSRYSGANQRTHSWSRSGSCHDWENAWFTLMPSRHETTLLIIVYAVHRPKQRRRRAHAHRIAVPGMKMPPRTGASSYLQPRENSGPGVRDGDRPGRTVPLHVGAQALGDEAQREHRATVQDQRHDLWICAVDGHRFAIHQCARLPDEELKSGFVERYGHRPITSIPGNCSPKRFDDCPDRDQRAPLDNDRRRIQRDAGAAGLHGRRVDAENKNRPGLFRNNTHGNGTRLACKFPPPPVSPQQLKLIDVQLCRSSLERAERQDGDTAISADRPGVALECRRDAYFACGAVILDEQRVGSQKIALRDTHELQRLVVIRDTTPHSVEILHIPCVQRHLHRRPHRSLDPDSPDNHRRGSADHDLSPDSRDTCRIQRAADLDIHGTDCPRREARRDLNHHLDHACRSRQHRDRRGSDRT